MIFDKIRARHVERVLNLFPTILTTKMREENHMKSKTYLIAGMLTVVFVLSLLTMPALASKTEKKGKAQTETISGTIKELSKDRKGKVTAVAIDTDSGQYAIEKKGKMAKELLKMVGKHVEATGTVKVKKGKKSIRISSYKVSE
jgi:hypothetical protein